MKIVYAIIIFVGIIEAFNVNTKPSKISSYQTNQLLRTINTCFKILTPIAIVSSLTPMPVNAQAVQGSIKPSSLAETKESILVLQSCIESVKQMETDATAGDYQAVADKLSAKNFKALENAATVMVRSDALTSDEKTTLGTIRRYGIVADALIMLGGLAGELKSGGIKVTYGGESPIQKGIEDDEAEEETTTLNVAEVKRYIKLSKDSLQDIFNVVKPILTK